MPLTPLPEAVLPEGRISSGSHPLRLTAQEPLPVKSLSVRVNAPLPSL